MGGAADERQTGGRDKVGSDRETWGDKASASDGGGSGGPGASGAPAHPAPGSPRVKAPRKASSPISPPAPALPASLFFLSFSENRIICGEVAAPHRVVAISGQAVWTARGRGPQ